MITRLTAVSTAIALVLGLALSLATTAQNKQATAAKTTTKTKRGLSYSVQGDSLSVMARPYLKKSLPGYKRVSFSAEIGRQYWDGEKILHGQRLGRVVIFALGSNSWQSSEGVFAETIRRIRQEIGPRRCLVMASIYDQEPIASFNKIIYQEADRAGPARFQVAPWAETVDAGRVRLGDGLHPATKSGAKTFARLLGQSAAKCS